MIFVKSVKSNFSSGELRGDHIARSLGTKCFINAAPVRNDVVVFVKFADPIIVFNAKEAGNLIVYDVLDYFCYGDRKVQFADTVDVVIVPNLASVEFYKMIFPKAKFTLIPHQWDYRIEGRAPQDAYRPGYIGEAFNMTPRWHGEAVTDKDEFLKAAPRFNLHIAINAPTRRLLKPATKVVTAAAVGANVLTMADPSALELVGLDYPYIYVGEGFERVENDFGSSTWKRGLETMEKVRERTSLEAVSKLYRDGLA